MSSTTTKSSKKRVRKSVQEGCVHIRAGMNNTIISITDLEGNLLVQSSAGSSGFKGTRKSTPYAAQMAAEQAVEKIKVYDMSAVKVYIKGIGQGREQAIRGLLNKGLHLISIFDITPIPHNGCRLSGRRRI